MSAVVLLCGKVFDGRWAGVALGDCERARGQAGVMRYCKLFQPSSLRSWGLELLHHWRTAGLHRREKYLLPLITRAITW